jgi:DNA-binding transcriptional ArsR family regulator
MEQEIRLSSSEFKALASETRANIIRLLKERNHTLTEISKKLKMAAPTIKQHLGILENADLIQELDEGRKWKYYELTRKGKNIFAAETPVNVLIVLGASIIALVGMLYSFISMLGSQTLLVAGKGEAFIEKANDFATAPVAGAAEEAAGEAVEQQAMNWFGTQPELIVLAVGIIAVAMLAGYLIARVR